jgi:hemolysin III
VTDERVNAVTHLAAAVFSLLGMVLLIVKASIAGNPWQIVSFSIYGLSLFCLFLFSALHHGINASPRVEQALRSLDYACVFFLIAGSLTPVCLVLVRGAVGWSVLGVVWTLCVAGIVLRLVFPGLPKWVTNTLYITLGWLAVCLGLPVLAATSWFGLALMAVGGILYSLGLVVYVVERPNILPGRFGFHELWHLLVMLGAAAHYAFVYCCILPVRP